MYSATVDGKVLDFHFRLISKDIYNFSIGEIFIGQIFKQRRGWSCVSFRVVHELGAVMGLRTRLDAAELLLKMNKIGGR